MFRINDNQDRVNYGRMLLPPQGYQLEKAVGTTYSLDLETLTAIAISLDLMEDTDSKLLQNRINRLNALQKVSKKILIFCEDGQIKRPTHSSPLNLLLEKMVIPVALPKAKGIPHYPAFHPKTWILEYKNNKGDYFYKFAVLSRNLTFDRSWDIVFCMDSTEEVFQPEKTKPLISFLGFLYTQVKNTTQDAVRKRKQIKALMDHLEMVSFSLKSNEFGENFTIMPLGIGEEAYDITKDPLLCSEKDREDNRFDELVVVSPFLTRSVIGEWNKSEHALDSTSRTLITRKSELSKLTEAQTSNFQIFTLKDHIVDGEDQLSNEETIEKKRQDIHAKMYLRRKNSNVDLYLGSMNASYSGIHKNVEMMVRIGTIPSYLNKEIFLQDLFCGSTDDKENPFEEVSIKKPEEDRAANEINALELLIKNICRMPKKAVVMPNKEKYNIQITISGDIPKGNIHIAPFRRKVSVPLDNMIQFENLELLQLSEFYEIIAKGEEITLCRIIMIPTTGIPEERENAVVNSVVKDRKSFVEYVAFVLGEDYLLSMLERHALQESGFARKQEERMPALYEKMLKTALEEPERIKEIGYLLKMITKKDIVPDEFRELYNTFCKTLNLK